MWNLFAKHRFLIRELVFRDIKGRYVGSFLGIFWSLINPLLQLILYTVIFSTVLNVRFGEEASTGRFAEHLFCALLPWMAFQEAVTRSSRIFIDSANLIQKVRFPLEILPLSLVVSAFVHQLLGGAILTAVLLYNGTLSPSTLWMLFLLLPLQLLMTHGLSLFVACFNVFFRDTAQVLGVAFMLLFWVTPIVYPRLLAEQAGPVFLWILNLNPLTHMVEAYRHAFLLAPPPNWTGLLYWAASGLLLFVLGRYVLSRTRNTLVDLV